MKVIMLRISMDRDVYKDARIIKRHVYGVRVVKGCQAVGRDEKVDWEGGDEKVVGPRILLWSGAAPWP